MSKEETVTITHHLSIDERFDIIEQQFRFVANILKELIEKVDLEATALSDLRDKIAVDAYGDIEADTWEERASIAYEAADIFIEARKS